MEGAKVPKGLLLEGNLKENFRKFKLHFMIYLNAAGLTELSSETRVAILLNVIGEEAVELFETFALTDEERKDFEIVFGAFERYTNPRQNVVMERFNFSSRIQAEGESVDGFITDLKKLGKSCEYRDQFEDFVRDRIVFGVRDKGVQERLLRIQGLTLEKAIDICRAAEISRAQSETLQAKTNTVYSVNSRQGAEFRREQQFQVDKYRPRIKIEKKSHGDTYIDKCNKCNRKHEFGRCPAYGKKCMKCGKNNHFAVVCKTKAIRELGKEETKEGNVSDSDSSEFGIAEVKIYKLTKNNKWNQSVQIGQSEYNFKIDTGAEISVITYGIVKELNKENNIKETSIILEAFGGIKTKALGTISLKCKIPGKESRKKIDFVVVTGGRSFRPILGADDCENLNLVRRVYKVEEALDKEQFIKKYIKQFTGQGVFKGKYKIKVKPDAQPVAKPPRRIPEATRKKLETTLQRLVKEQIIVKEPNPEGWVSNLVLVEKSNGSLRLCLDPCELNKNIIKSHYLIPTLEDMSPKLCRKQAYTVLDLKNGFWHIKLSEDSSKLCTFSTPFGCYRFKRMPFGLSTAPEVFQKINVQNFGDIEGVVIYFDDLLIAGSTLEEHDTILRKVMERARTLNITFNKTKLQYRVPEVKYFGQVFTYDGVKPDPEKVNAIKTLKTPTNKVELQRLLGMINYLRKYIPHMAELTAPLRELLRKENCWIWLPKHEIALEVLKDRISQAPTIKNWNPNLPMEIHADSSKHGLGCCLFQEGRPIAYASRSLTAAEINYSQVEKELLAVAYATQKFHLYIYGTRVTIKTDHKPLVTLMKKEIHRIPSTRLQRLRLKLLIYEIQLEYLPGKKMFVADLLSRNFVHTTQEDDKQMVEMVHSLTVDLQITEERKEEFKRATRQDEILMQVMEYQKEGWPNNMKRLPASLKHFERLKNELIVAGELLFLGNKLVVPEKLRQGMLTLLHRSHFGVEKTKNRARQLLYWPGLSRDITQMVKHCRVCNRFMRKNVKVELQKHELPELPFDTLGADICEYGGQSFLVAACYLTKWLEIIKLRDKTADGVIKALKTIFFTHGIPRKLVADNMPFGSLRIRNFAKDWDFQLITSSPHYPQSNGFAERMVGIAKGILKRAENDHQEYRETLLEYRNSPLTGSQVSPAQLLMSRRLRTKVPICKSLLKPKLQLGYRADAKKLKKSQVKYYNRSSVKRPELEVGQDVWYRDKNEWEPAQVIQKHVTPRSYIIKTQEGQELRRNEIVLRGSTNKIFEKSSMETDEQTEGDEVKGGDQTQADVSRKETELIQESSSNVTKRGRLVKVPIKYEDYVL